MKTESNRRDGTAIMEANHFEADIRLIFPYAQSEFVSLEIFRFLTNRAEQRLHHPFLKKLHSMVEQQACDPISIEALAKAVCLTRVQLFRKLKELTGQSPSRFIRTIRLKMATELLCTTDMNVSEVAYHVGFDDPKYFARVFAEEFGLPPSQFKNHLRPAP